MTLFEEYNLRTDVHPYSENYIDDWMDENARFFASICTDVPSVDFVKYVKEYMNSNVRRLADEGVPRALTYMEGDLEYILAKEGIVLVPGPSVPESIGYWIGLIYTFLPWYFNVSSKWVCEKIPVEWLLTAYPGLHTRGIEDACEKLVGMR